MVSNVVLNNKVNINSSPAFKKKNKVQVLPKTPEEKLNQIYRSQGLLGKLFDKIQGTLGFGLSKKSLQKSIASGDSSKLDKYYDNQKNSTEVAIDVLTGVSAASSFRLIKKLQTYSHLYVKNAKFEKYSTLAGIGISAVTGMIIKPILKAFNNIGTPKEDRKRERTVLKDIGSGFVDGACAPLAYIHKLGLLAAAGINSLSRYTFNKKADKNSDFADHLSNGWLAKAGALGLAGFSAFKFHKRIDVLEKAIVKSKENVKNSQVFKSKMPLTELADLAKSNLKDKKTQVDLVEAARRGFFSKTYLKITGIFRRKKDHVTPLAALEFAPKPAKRIIFMNKELIKEKEMNNIMREIEQYNIFYPKMIQSMPSNISAIADLAGGSKKISEMFGEKTASAKKEGWLGRFFNKRKEYVADKGIKSVNDFLNNYKSCCPASRTVKEAQKYVSETYGKRFTLQGDKPLGVGTIAETFLAKDNETGKDVVIKVVKKWVSADKLKADKENMLKSLERVKDKIKPDDYDYQRKLVDELYNAWSKEINLGLEAEAAETLGKYAINYNTVKPISVKNNIFVMERANGVQFDKFAEYLEKNNITLSMNEAADLLTKYMQVFFEQLLSVPKKGHKVMHADPHAGNIFIDINNKKKPFTFIDTGNVMRYTPEEAIQNVVSHLDYLIGNSKSISRKLLKGATLPDGMSQKQAEELLSKHLDETFFSGKYKIRTSDPFSAINNEAMDFMKKNKVILNSDNTNLLKAELTYLVNLVSISKIGKNIDFNGAVDEKQMAEQMKLMSKQIGESLLNGISNNKQYTLKEVRERTKYIEKNPEQFFTTLYGYIPPNSFNNIK